MIVFWEVIERLGGQTQPKEASPWALCVDYSQTLAVVQTLCFLPQVQASKLTLVLLAAHTAIHPTSKMNPSSLKPFPIRYLLTANRKVTSQCVEEGRCCDLHGFEIDLTGE